MAILHKNISASADIHVPKWLPSANNGDYAFKNEKGELESIDELLLPGALNFVDGSVAPPTTSTGDIYILSSGASVNAGWGSVALQDWVRYDGTAWNSLTPQKSSLCYDKTADSLKFFNGTAWAAIGGGGGGGNTIYTADDSITGNRTVDLSNKTLTFSTANTGYAILKNSSSAVSSGQKVLEIKANHSGGVSGCGGYIDFSSANGNYNVGRIHNYQFSSGNAGFRVFSLATDGTANLGNSYLGQDGFSALIGENVVSRVGSEKISLQGHTLIKGADTLSTSSALQIYDGDSTPAVLWDFRNNGDIVQGVNSIYNFNGKILNFDASSGGEMKITGNTTKNYYFLTNQSTSSGYTNSTRLLTSQGSAGIKSSIDNFYSNTAGTDTRLSRLTLKDDSILNYISKNGGILAHNFVSSLGNTETATFDYVSRFSHSYILRFNIGGTYTAEDYYRITTGLDYILDRNNTIGFNIGIGTNDTPAAKLTVNGHVILNGTTKIGTEDVSLQGNTLLNANVNMPNLPTSATGLSIGDIYNDSGTLKIV